MDPAITEALRRRQGLGDSSAGISGGAQSANANTPTNPLAVMGATPMQSVGAPQQPQQSQQLPSQGAVSALKGAYPQEAGMIISALTKTLDRLVPKTEQPLM